MKTLALFSAAGAASNTPLAQRPDRPWITGIGIFGRRDQEGRIRRAGRDLHAAAAGQTHRLDGWHANSRRTGVPSRTLISTWTLRASSGIEREGLHLADPDAVEADARAGGEPSHRALEDDVVALPAAGEIAHPEDEDEGKARARPAQIPRSSDSWLWFPSDRFLKSTLATAAIGNRDASAARPASPRAPARRRNIP